MALDREPWSAVVKGVFLPVQDRGKKPRTAKRVKAWYEQPTGPSPSHKMEVN